MRDWGFLLGVPYKLRDDEGYAWVEKFLARARSRSRAVA